MEWAALVQLTTGMVLAIAAAAKWVHPSRLTLAIREYGVIPERFAPLAAGVVLAAESAIAAALLGRITRDAALFAAAILLLAFACLIAWTLVKRRPTDCGCLGASLKLRMGWISVGMNVALAGGAIAASAQPQVVSVPATSYATLYLSAALLAVLYWLVTYASSVARLVADSFQIQEIR